MYYNNQTILFKNGNFIPVAQAMTNTYSQTLHYGYGVFEGIRSYQTAFGTHIFKAKEHYDRLANSCKLLSIPFSWHSEYLIEKTYELLKINSLTDAYIRPIVVTEPNMSLSVPKHADIIIMVWSWGNYLGNNSLRVCSSSYCRPHPKSIQIEAKANGHYVNSILATIEAKQNGYDEALLNDVDGNLAEAPGANLFIEKDGKLYTPQKGNILPGITRNTLIELCYALDISIEETTQKPNFLEQADAAFLCGTAAEVIGIQSYNEVVFPIEFENSLGKKLQTAYKKLVLNQL